MCSILTRVRRRPLLRMEVETKGFGVLRNSLTQFRQINVDPDAYMQHFNKYEETTLIADGGGGKKFRGLTEFTSTERETFSRINEVHVLLPHEIEGLALHTKRVDGI